jgi:hypothetical protein
MEFETGSTKVTSMNDTWCLGWIRFICDVGLFFKVPGGWFEFGLISNVCFDLVHYFGLKPWVPFHQNR